MVADSNVEMFFLSDDQDLNEFVCGEVRQARRWGMEEPVPFLLAPPHLQVEALMIETKSHEG